jgi:hypothetical protein
MHTEGDHVRTQAEEASTNQKRVLWRNQPCRTLTFDLGLWN